MPNMSQQASSSGYTDTSQPGHPLAAQIQENTAAAQAQPTSSRHPRPVQDGTRLHVHQPEHPASKINTTRLKELTTQLELEELLEERKTVHTEEEKEKAWVDVAGMVKAYSDEMIDRWNKAIDTYLVFAGLFSAILTAFNVQSYPLLQPPNSDPTAVLQQISRQLQSFSISPPFINSTASPADASLPDVANASVSIPRSAIWLNILWFSGLILSLTSALVGILVKQWLNEYVSLGLTGTSREARRLRQYRLNNLVKWRVGDIVIIIPALLLISLALFLAGLLVLLWTLHPAVAIVSSVLVGAVSIFTVGVTFLPVFKTGCAYITPQTFAFWSIWRHIFYPVIRPAGYHLLSRPMHKLRRLLPSRFSALLSDILWCISDLFPAKSITFPWHAYERRVVYDLSVRLDMDILNKAYDCTLDVKAVSAAAVCLLDEDSVRILEYLKQLNKTAEWHFRRSHSRYPKDALLAYQALLCTRDFDAKALFSEGIRASLRMDSSSFLPAGGPDSPSKFAGTPQEIAWLRKAASWLESQALDPRGTNVMFPIDCRLSGELASHYLILAWENKTARSGSNATRARDDATSLVPSRHTETSLYFELLRSYRLWDSLLEGSYKDHGTSSPLRAQAERRYLLAVRDCLHYCGRALSSTDASAPQDHHVIRTHTHKALFGLHEFLFNIELSIPEDLRYWSQEHLHLISDILDAMKLHSTTFMSLLRVSESSLVSPLIDMVKIMSLPSFMRGIRPPGTRVREPAVQPSLDYRVLVAETCISDQCDLRQGLQITDCVAQSRRGPTSPEQPPLQLDTFTTTPESPDLPALRTVSTMFGLKHSYY